jgi:adenylate cyclase
LLAEKEKASPEQARKVEIFTEARALYLQRRWEEARQVFESLAEDPLAEVYAERCRLMKVNPPPEDWDGVFTLKEK